MMCRPIFVHHPSAIFFLVWLGSRSSTSCFDGSIPGVRFHTMPTFFTSRPRHLAFSMMELLVVIAIMTLLISLTLPSLRQSKESANAMQCTNNLRQLMVANTSYCGDNSEYMPFPNWGGYGRDLGGGWKIGGWLYFNKANVDWNTDALWTKEVLQTGLIWNYTQREAGIYRCIEELPPYPPLSGQITSYNMNGSVCGYGDARTFRLEKWTEKDYLMWEVDPEVIQAGWWWDGANHPGEGISSNRHLQGGTAAAADCHVDWLQYKDFYTEAGKPTKNKLWNAPDTTNGR